MLLLDGQVHHDTHAIPMGNYVIEVGNYVIVSPSELGNYKIVDSDRADHENRRGGHHDPGRSGPLDSGRYHLPDLRQPGFSVDKAAWRHGPAKGTVPYLKRLILQRHFEIMRA